MIHKITPSVGYTYWIKRLNTQLNKPTNQNLVKVPTVVRPTHKKTLLQTLGTSVINRTLAPLSAKTTRGRI